GFWYRVGSRYIAVDPAAGTRRDAFDHDRLAAALSEASGTAVDASDLPFAEIELEAGGGGGEDAVRFSAFGARWQWSGGACTRIDDRRPGPQEIPSPDGAWFAFGRDGNVWIRARDGGEEIALTGDAEPHHGYGALPDFMSGRTLMRTLGLGPAFTAVWSPDSSRLLVHRLDQ